MREVMFKLESLLSENDLSNMAFSIIERFSTQRPLNDVLTEIIRMIGHSIRLWTNADLVVHLFANPRLVQCHRLLCATTIDELQQHLQGYHEEWSANVPVPHFSPSSEETHWRPKLVTSSLSAEIELLRVAEFREGGCRDQVAWCQLDFVNQAPLGQFVVIWHRSDLIPESRMFYVQSVLWSLARVLSALLCSHYAIHPNTYMPTFQSEGSKEAAILSADIRNSTPLFEIARLGGEPQMMRVETLLRVWFRFAAELIASPGLGSLHSFTGDGLIATFGEYAIPTDELKAPEIGCAVALHVGRHLVLAFQRLYEKWRNCPSVSEFHRDQNEDVDLCLGVGINFGRVMFAHIGRSAEPSTNEAPAWKPGDSAYLEYSAFGDHMNTAARLGDVASKLAANIDLVLRAAQHRDEFRIMPIVLSHTAAQRLSIAMNLNLQNRRGKIRLKGKGHELTFYELDVSEVDDHRLADLLRGVAEGYFADRIRNPPSIERSEALLEQRLGDID